MDFFIVHNDSTRSCFHYVHFLIEQYLEQDCHVFDIKVCGHNKIILVQILH